MEEIDIIHPSESLKYISIELENELSALLISENLSERKSSSYAAASMAVRVGSFYDPPDILGLSHFFGMVYVFCLSWVIYYDVLCYSFDNSCKH